jgi:hypothetical protein
MLASIMCRFRRCALLVAALLLAWPVHLAGADERADLRAALKQANAQYRTTLKTLETRGREETSAEVARLRAAFQAVIDQFDANPSAFPGDQDYAGVLMQLDASMLGVMIVVDIGSREAARDALAPIGETLSALSVRLTPPE